MESDVPRAAIQKRVVLAGRVVPDLSHFVVTQERLREIGTALHDTIDVNDVIVLLLVSFCTVPLARTFHTVWYGADKTPTSDESDEAENEPADPFKSTYTYHAALNLSQIAKIAIIVYVIDCFMVIVYMQGIDSPLTKDVDFGGKIARVLYLIWFSKRCMQFKRYLLGRIVNKSPEKLGKVLIYDRILDFVMYAILTCSIMDTVDIEIGAGLKSLFAFGGIGTLVFSLASKDMATLFVSGLVLSTSERFRPGDFISLGDKTSGTVVDTGFLYTSIRGGDEHIVKIPNTQLANQRVSNLSRMSKSQVTQTLRFKYSDLDKVSQLISTIKQEIEASCPELIKDGSRPYRVTLKEFMEDHFQIVVDTRHNLPPIGNKYWDNRQRVLEAIAKAVAKNNVKFAIPERRILADE